MRRIFLIRLFVTLSIGVGAQRAAATNWHCYYTNCVYLFVPQVYEGQTVTAARAELAMLRRAERFGPLTNVAAGTLQAIQLQAAAGGFAVYHVFGAQQHRLWEPMELGMRVRKIVRYADGRQRALAALREGAYETVLCDDAREVLAFKRSVGEDTAVVVINNSESKQRVVLGELRCAGVWKRVLTGMAEREALELEAVAGEILVPEKRRPRG